MEGEVCRVGGVVLTGVWGFYLLKSLVWWISVSIVTFMISMIMSTLVGLVLRRF